MFKKLSTLEVYVQINGGRNFIPNVVTLGPLEQEFRATEWLVKEALLDYESVWKQFRERRTSDKKYKESFSDLSVRLGSRIQSYVNHICIMEDILRYEFERMESLLQNDLNFISIDRNEELELLKKRLKPVRLIRDKITAHVAYSKPQRKEKPDTVVRSIMNLFPRDGEVVIGESSYNNLPTLKREIPHLNIFYWEDDILPIFIDWEDLFEKKLLEIHEYCKLNLNSPIQVHLKHKSTIFNSKLDKQAKYRA